MDLRILVLHSSGSIAKGDGVVVGGMRYKAQCTDRKYMDRFVFPRTMVIFEVSLWLAFPPLSDPETYNMHILRIWWLGWRMVSCGPNRLGPRIFFSTQPRICLRNILPLPLSKFGGDGMWFWRRECNLQIETMPWWRLVRIVTSGPENMFNSLLGQNCNQRQNCSRWTEVSCLRFQRTAMFEVEPFVPHCKGPHKKGHSDKWAVWGVSQSSCEVSGLPHFNPVGAD